MLSGTEALSRLLRWKQSIVWHGSTMRLAQSEELTVPSRDPGHRVLLAGVGGPRIGFLIVLGGLALLASGLVMFTTPLGPGILGDSYYYLTASENLSAGRGIGRLSGGGEFRPLTHYPPFFPMAMASLQVLGLDKLDSARWVNAISAGALVLLVAVFVGSYTRGPWPALASAVILTTSPAMLEVNVWALSEPLYLVLAWACLGALACYLDTNRPWILAAAGVLASTAYLTRYVGSSLVLTGVVLLLAGRRDSRRRVAAAAGFGVISLAPMAAWMVRNYMLTGNLANRRILWHPIALTQLRSLVLHGVSWLAPKWLIHGRLVAILLALVLAGSVMALAVRAYKENRLVGLRPISRFAAILALNMALYLAQLAVSISFFDPGTSADNRILSPVYVSMIPFVVLLLAHNWNTFGRGVRVCIAAYLAILIASNASSLVAHSLNYRTEGLGYSHRSWQDSALIKMVKELPDVPIYTNGITELYIHASRSSYPIPWRIDSETQQVNQDYELQLEIMRLKLVEEDARLVLFDPENLLPQQARLDDLTAGLTAVAEVEDGAIYDYIP